uniref:Gamma-secretase subunit Aph-1 n=1 Tax=Steinernema glaseri TaxID=37863 RepID=A0A1I7ZRY9_9BILA
MLYTEWLTLKAALPTSCFVIAFAPGLAFFLKFVAKDSLRVILVVMAAFVWMLSLLLSSIIRFGMVYVIDSFLLETFISIALQEASRLVLFILIKQAQKGLKTLSEENTKIAGIDSLYRSRHMLSMVCGLGMGAIAALFLLLNLIAGLYEGGTMGLPATIPHLKERMAVKLSVDDRFFPITYSASCGILTLLHMAWTLLFWDSCHKYGTHGSSWWFGMVIAVSSHYLVSGLSFFNQLGTRVVILGLQFLVLLANILCCSYIVRDGRGGIFGCGGDDSAVESVRSENGDVHVEQRNLSL